MAVVAKTGSQAARIETALAEAQARGDHEAVSHLKAIQTQYTASVQRHGAKTADAAAKFQLDRYANEQGPTNPLAIAAVGAGLGALTLGAGAIPAVAALAGAHPYASTGVAVAGAGAAARAISHADEATDQQVAETQKALAKAKTPEEKTRLQGVLDGLTFGANAPDYVLNAFGGRAPTPDELQRILAEFNGYMPTDRKVKDTKELGSRLAKDPDHGLLAVSAVAGGNPNEAIDFPLGPSFGNKRVTVPRSEIDYARRVYPNISANYGAVARVAEQTGVDRAALAAAASVADLFKSMSTSDQQEQTALAAALGMEGQVADGGLLPFGKKFAESESKYGDKTVALVASADPALANHLYTNPYGLSAEERSKLGDILAKAHWDSSVLANMGVNVDPSKLDFVQKLAAGADTNQVFEVPNGEKMRQSIDTLWRGWFQHAPSEPELAQFVADVNRVSVERQKAARPNPFQPDAGTKTVEQLDPESQATAYARSQPEYQSLFSHRGAGQSEDQYVQQFRSSATQLFGADGLQQSDAIRAGMETGDTQTTLGQLANSKAAMDNSTFLGRLAQAAQIVGQYT